MITVMMFVMMTNVMMMTMNIMIIIITMIEVVITYVTKINKAPEASLSCPVLNGRLCLGLRGLIRCAWSILKYIVKTKLKNYKIINKNKDKTFTNFCN